MSINCTIFGSKELTISFYEGLSLSEVGPDLHFSSIISVSESGRLVYLCCPVSAIKSVNSNRIKALFRLQLEILNIV
jgi:hypothetical protein